MNKKAFEIQFNWIFILVAGAAILLFFASVIVKQKNISETSTRATVLKSIDAIITGASVTIDTTKIENIPSSEIDVGCNRVAIGSLSSDVSKQYQNLILFSPSSIKGSKFIWQTAAFSVPFRAINLLYIASPQVRYIIIGSSTLAIDINKSMPADLKKEFYQSIPSIKNENNYKIRLIVFENIDMSGINLKNLEKMPDLDVTAIKVNGDNEKGTINFYQKNGDSWMSKGSSSYIQKSSLIGAVYTDTLDAYQCNMQNVFSRLNLVTKIYADRTNELIKTTSQLSCRQFYSNALAELNKISAASSSFNKNNVDAIVDSAKSLANINNDAKTYSCPLLY